MFIIKADTAEELFLKGLERCKTGWMVAPRGLSTLEVPEPVCFILTSPRHNVVTNPYRKLNYVFGLVEAIQVWNGQNSVEQISWYNSKMKKFSDNGTTFNGAYGPPFLLQKDFILNTLKKDRDSRQAVITLWRQTPLPSKDIPCTVMLHFFIRDFLLNLTVYMRSNDIWLGFPYDVTVFSRLQCQIAAELGFRPGTLRHIAGSLHMYAGDIYKAEFALKYAGKLAEHVGFDPPRIGDLGFLATAEEDTRHGKFPAYKATESFLSIGIRLLAEHNAKKINPNYKPNYPEPYASLIEEAKVVQGHFKDNKGSKGSDEHGGGAQSC